MRRRTYLGVLASGIGLAGCMGEDGGGEATPTATAEPTPTPTPEPTPTPTKAPTPTPTPTEPVVERTNLVWGAGSGHWVREHALASVGAGTQAGIGVWFGTPAEPSEIEPTVEATVLDADGSIVGSQSSTFSDESPRRNYLEKRVWVGVDLSGQPVGTYTAEVTVSDPFTRTTSEPARFEFDLVEPLQANEVELVRATPDRAAVGEPVNFRVHLRNRSSRDSSFRGTVGYSTPNWNGSVEFTDVSWAIPAESTVMHELDGVVINEPDSYELSIPGVDIHWHVEAEEST